MKLSDFGFPIPKDTLKMAYVLEKSKISDLPTSPEKCVIEIKPWNPTHKVKYRWTHEEIKHTVKRDSRLMDNLKPMKD